MEPVGLQRRASMPKARVSGEDEVFEEELDGMEGDGDDSYGAARISPADEVGGNPSLVDGEANPSSEEGSDEVALVREPNSVDPAAGVKETKNSNLEESSEVKVEKTGENQDESIEAALESVDSGVGVQGNQDPSPDESLKVFGGEDEKVGESPDKPVIEATVQEEKDDEQLKGGDGVEEEGRPAVEAIEEPKPVDSVPVSAGDEKEEKDGVDSEKAVESVPVAAEEKEENDGVDSEKPLESVPAVAEEEKEEKVGVDSEKQPVELVPVAAEEKKEDKDGVGSEMQPVELVPVAAEENNDEKIGVDSGRPLEATTNGEEAEKAGAGDIDVSVQNSEKVNAFISENLELKSNELKSGLVVVENNGDENLEVDSRELKSDAVEAESGEGLNGDTVSEKTEASYGSSSKVDTGNDGEDVVGAVRDEKRELFPKDTATGDSAVAAEGGDSLGQDAGENNVASPSEEASGLTELSERKLDVLKDDVYVFLDQDAGKNKGVTQFEEVSADLHANSHGGEPEVVADDGGVVSSEVVASAPVLVEEIKSRDVVFGDSKSLEADDDEIVGDVEPDEEEEGLVSNGPARVAILESSETAKQIIKELEGGSSSNSSQDYRNAIEGHIASDSDEEVDTDEEGDGKELFDSAALAALLKAATGASGDGGITISSGDSTRIFAVDRPAGLGSSGSSLKPLPPRPARSNVLTPTDLAVTAEPENNMDEEEKKLHEKVEMIRVKFLRLIERLGHSADDTVASQVLYRLSLAEGIRRGRQMNRVSSLENAKKKARQLEAEGKDDLDFSCNILVLGKSGVGKSATINSIFGEEKSKTSAFELATSSVKEISGIVDGVKIRVIDTPGLKASAIEQAANRKILSSIKKYTKRCPPDIVLYVDRMDTQTRDFNDLPLLRSITSTLGSSIWFNAIVALTHAASAPPDGLNGTPLSYEVFIAQRSHVVQQSIRQAASDVRLMNPVALVENHPSCRRNREGEKVLPNGQSWRPQMLLLCYSSKILSEANSLLKLQDANPGKLFGFRLRAPPLPFLLSSLLQSRTHPKLSSDQGIDNGDSDIDLDDLSDSDQEDEEDDYDQLPPFRPLKKAQIAKLTKEQKKAYYEEYDYRVRLLQKKQWKEEIRRLKEMKKRGKGAPNEYVYGDMAEDYDQDAAPAAVPVPLPDMVLPPTFDGDNPAYRYRFLEPTSQLLTRPVLDTHGWDHDCGYDGVSIEQNLALLSRFPAGVSVQITKDKKDFNIHLDSSISAKHDENVSTLAGLDIQTVGKQLAYILRGETKFKNFKKNKTTGGVSVTFLGETVATGLKIEDQISIGRQLSLVASTGAIRAQGDTAYGANLEARLREKDYPIGQVLATLGLSLMIWRGDLALGANVQSQLSAGRNYKVAVRGSLNNKLSGQITVKTSSSEQLQIALLAIIPVAVSIFRKVWPVTTSLLLETSIGPRKRQE
ncbi:putative small monomeric GTPase [Dioscorea sansibarensis]